MGRFILITVKINQNLEKKLYNCRRWHHQLKAKDADMKLMASREVGSLRLLNIKLCREKTLKESTGNRL
jgi:hypothetical protein